jgi:hypothetical protein
VFYVLRRHDFGARASNVFDTRQTTAIKFLRLLFLHFICETICKIEIKALMGPRNSSVDFVTCSWEFLSLNLFYCYMDAISVHCDWTNN